jgi:hypothetical protein
MNPDQVKKALRLIEDRKNFRLRLDDLNKASGYPAASLKYYNNAGLEVCVSIPVTLQETVESLLRAILEGQVTKMEGDLRELGVEIDD